MNIVATYRVEAIGQVKFACPPDATIGTIVNTIEQDIIREVVQDVEGGSRSLRYDITILEDDQ